MEPLVLALVFSCDCFQQRWWFHLKFSAGGISHCLTSRMTRTGELDAIDTLHLIFYMFHGTLANIYIIIYRYILSWTW
jgi:hypothetical protein